MCQEYISSSKPAILGMASRLGAFEQVFSKDPVVEVEVEVEEVKEVAQENPLMQEVEEAQEVDNKPMMQEMEEFIILEEDPELYAMAGMELVPAPVPMAVQDTIESTIRQAMASLPAVSGNTVNFKIVVLNDNNSGNLLF